MLAALLDGGALEAVVGAFADMDNPGATQAVTQALLMLANRHRHDILADVRPIPLQS